MNGPTAVRPGHTARTRSSSLILRAQDFSFLICSTISSLHVLWREWCGAQVPGQELAWESRKLEKRNQQLDKFYNEQHSKRTREHLVKRVPGEVLSAQQKPVDCRDWACINTNNSSSISTQGWALAEFSGPWHPTLALGDLDNLKSHEFTRWEHWAPLNLP